MKKLEENLEKLLAYIIDYKNEKGYPPTVRDMCAELDIKSTNTIHYYLKKLEDNGKIIRDINKNRAIEVVDKSALIKPTPIQINRDENMSTIPLVGTIAAGIPILAEQNYINTYDVSKSLFRGDELFMLVVKGDSMIDAGILSGDYVVVKKQNVAENGDIVAAMVDDGATVKTFYKTSDAIKLQPQNPFYSPIVSKNITILGIVIGVIRKF